MMRLLILNGPNLNLLGTREPATYGAATLADVEADCARFAKELGVEVQCLQSNSEGGLIDALHRGRGTVDGVVLNAGGYTHTSVALRDAISGTALPCVEVHISNVHARESFRHTSLITPVCIGVIAGFGVVGYRYGMRAVVDHVAARR